MKKYVHHNISWLHKLELFFFFFFIILSLVVSFMLMENFCGPLESVEIDFL